MSRVFISYRRTDPDQDLANSLAQTLEQANHEVFWDNYITLGEDWAEVIEREIREAEFFVVLISAESMRSAMVREEVRTAYKHSRRTDRPLRILPIWVDYQGEPPLDLRAYLNPINREVWTRDGSLEETARRVREAVDAPSRSIRAMHDDSAASPSPIGLQTTLAKTENAGAPLPAAEPILESGTMRVESPFYIERAEDRTVHAQALGRGTTTVIRGPRQIGKSSLLARLRPAATARGFRVFYLDFAMIDAEPLETLERLLQFIARELARELRTAVEPKKVWRSGEGPKTNLRDFLDQAVLAAGDAQILFLFDEMDQVFGHADYRDDFFAMIRGWHNLRAQRDCWNRLNLVLAHSTEPALWIQDLNQSPFNVGERVRLRDFDLPQVAELNRRYGSPVNDHDLPRLMQAVGGHPFLLRQAFYDLARIRQPLEQYLRVAAELDGPFGDHLRWLLWRFRRDHALAASLKQIVRSGRCKDEIHFQRLWDAGLVTGVDRLSAAFRCEIYRTFFRQHL